MKNYYKSVTVFFLSLFLLVSLSACAQKTPDLAAPPPPPHNSALNKPAPTSKEDLSANKNTKLSVSGEGKIEIAPDMAVVRLGAISQKEHARDAQDRVNNIVKNVLKSLINMGVDKKNIQTASMTLSPIYKRDNSSSATKITAYRASNTIKLRVVHLSRIGQIISQAVKDGANNIQGISYQLQDDTKAKTLALSKAVSQAEQKAKAVADYMGLKLTSVAHVQIGNTSAHWFTPPRAVAQTLSSSYKVSSTPTQPGQIKVTANVSVTYNLTK